MKEHMNPLQGTADIDTLRMSAIKLRKKLEKAFSADTAVEGTESGVPSAGHCAAAAALIQRQIGGDLVSALVGGESHWFNRVRVSGSEFDVDLTGDQFGCEPVRIAKAGHLYPLARTRDRDQLSVETLERAALLASRAGLLALAKSISDETKMRHPASERAQDPPATESAGPSRFEGT